MKTVQTLQIEQKKKAGQVYFSQKMATLPRNEVHIESSLNGAPMVRPTRSLSKTTFKMKKFVLIFILVLWGGIMFPVSIRAQNPNCLCSTDGFCTSGCVFDKFNTAITYADPIKCNLNDIFQTDPTTDNKKNWCEYSKKTKGDADGNGIIDTIDYFYYVASVNGGKIPPTVNPDFNGDGEVGGIDRIIIIRSLSLFNPFGVMTWGNDNLTKTQIATDLGAKYYRPLSVFLDSWQGACSECDAAVNTGLKLVLTVRNNGGAGQPTTPPSDLNVFKQTLSQIIDKYKPEVLIIENEENSATLFYNGTVQQYLQELSAGCEVAHQKGIKCANGGLVSSLVVVLVSENYKNNGNPNGADDYLRRALTPEDYSTITASIGSSLWLSQIQKGQELLAGYKASGADFVNFHWHQENAETLPEALTYLGTASQGLPVINNEISPQESISPDQVTSFMQKVLDLNLSYAVWYSNDADGIGGPTALTDRNGVFNDSGRAYQQFTSKLK